MSANVHWIRTNSEYLLVTNGELSLRLLVCVGKCFKLLDRLCLEDLHAEFDIAFCVFMARLEQHQVRPESYKDSKLT